MTHGGRDAAILHPNVILNEVKNLFMPGTHARDHRSAPRQDITGVCRTLGVLPPDGRGASLGSSQAQDDVVGQAWRPLHPRRHPETDFPPHAGSLPPGERERFL